MPTPEEFNAIANVTDYKRYNANAGLFYFSRDAVRFFKTRVIRGVKRDDTYVYIRISDENWNNHRVYSIVRMDKSGHCEKLPNAEHLPTLATINAVWRTL